MLEHVRSPARPVRAAQRLLEPLAVRFEADHLLREPLDYLPSVGSEIEIVERSRWGIVERPGAANRATRGRQASSTPISIESWLGLLRRQLFTD
jgi:hypothetical protein